MAKYLISFPSAAMVVPDREWEALVERIPHGQDGAGLERQCIEAGLPPPLPACVVGALAPVDPMV